MGKSKTEKRLERDREAYRRSIARANPSVLSPTERNKLLGTKKGKRGK